MTAPEGSRRLFFALWPDPETLARSADSVRRWAPQGAGRPQRPEQLHLTLEFLGNVPESSLGAIQAAGQDAARASEPFSIVLDRLEHWRRPQVLCLTASNLPEPLLALVAALRAGLEVRGFKPEQRPFKAHLTLARQVRRAALVVPVESLLWPARELSLVESQTGRAGSHYERIATWPLGL
jgi:2'-5' RNA ligase